MKNSICWAVVGMSIGSIAGCVYPLVARMKQFEAARKKGDFDSAASMLSSDPRLWFERREGDGTPLRPEGGPYAEWDKEFHTTSKKCHLRAGKDEVRYLIEEDNEYYRLIDRVPGRVEITYYFNADAKISGKLVRGLTPWNRRSPDRRCEFEQWAAKKYPGLLDSEEMKIPKNPRRWRELLTEWRAEVELPPITPISEGRIGCS